MLLLLSIRSFTVTINRERQVRVRFEFNAESVCEFQRYNQTARVPERGLLGERTAVQPRNSRLDEQSLSRGQ